jgi:hypothetical protein
LQTTKNRDLQYLYIVKYPWRKYQPISFGGKNIKRGREKGGKCKRKRKKGGRKGKERGRKGKKNRKRKAKGKINAK